jgi:hypothetical protein
MRPEEFSDRLRRGAADVAAQTDPAPAGTVRRRGEWRRHRNMAASGLLAFAIGAGGGGYAYASFTTPAGNGNTVPITGASTAAPALSNGTGRPSIVAVTTAGAVVVLNPVTGEATATLTGPQDAVGDEIAVSPDGSTVYFAVHLKGSCADAIESVPLTGGGKPAVVADGVLPAISPDGRSLAFVREQVGGGVSPVRFGCGTDSGVQVVVQNLVTHRQTTYPAPPGAAAAPISHLSWAPGGQALLVSSGPVQDNQGWQLNRLDIATARYYLPDGMSAASARSVPATTSQSPGSYFEEGVYLPDGDLFVDRECCQGMPAQDTSSLLQVVGTSGTLMRPVAKGDLNRIHSSLDAVPGWLLYLSGTDLYIAADRWPAPKALSSFGFIAAAWVP